MFGTFIPPIYADSLLSTYIITDIILAYIVVVKLFCNICG